VSACPTDPYDLAELILQENPGIADAAREAGQNEEDAALEIAYVELALRSGEEGVA
jgi:hypothetical protein